MKIRSALYFGIFFLFLVAGSLATWFSFQPDSSASIAKQIAENLEEALIESSKDLDLLASSSDSFPDPTQFTYPVFHYRQTELLYWSDNAFVPSVRQVLDTFDIGLFTTGNDAYLLKKKTGDRSEVFVSVIPLLKRYPIRNDYLSPEFNSKILPSGNVNILDPNASLGIEVCIDGKCFFRISVLPDEIPSHSTMRKVAFLLLLCALTAFILFVYSLLAYFNTKHKEIGFLYLLIVLWGIRTVMTQTGFPGNFVQSKLFDPQVFASSSLNASLGDLFLNLLTVLALCFYVFKNYFHFSFVRLIGSKGYDWLIAVFAALSILFAALFPVIVIQTLYNNSTIALDISQSLQFDSLRVIAIFSVALSGICAFLFSHAFVRVIVKIGNRYKVLASFGIAVVIFSIINELTNQQYIPSLLISSLYFLVIYALNLYRSLKRLTFETFAYLFVAIFFMAINSAYAVQYFTHKEKIENQFRFASNFLIDRDIFGEYLLHETSQKIANDVFTQTRIASPFLGKEAIRHKIRQVFLPSYFNKYDVDIFIFNSQGEPLDNNPASLSTLINQYDKDSYRTGYEGVYFINNEELDVTQKYLILIPIKRLSVTSGYVIIQLSLKKIIPENVYPELLVDFRIQQFYRTQDLNYAVFANKKMIFNSGEFNYEKFFDVTWLGDPNLYTASISFANYDHIAVEDQTGRIAIVSTKSIPFIHKLSNFSFFLVFGLLIILVMIFIQGIYQYFRGSRLFFSARIQLYLNLAFFIPLIIVSISTLSLTSRSSQQQLNDEYLNKSKIFSQQMVNYLDDDEGTDENSETLSSRLTDLAKLSDLDANIYYPKGRLMATSQPLIFESNLISEFVNARAYLRVKNGDNLFIESERVGALKYFVSYAALRSPKTGSLIGILGIPFFQSAYLLEKVQSVILINILNIFAFIFIILLLLSYVVADRLTFPLRFITQSLRRTSLTKNNTPLTWPAEDEIGLMVKEYNAMLYKLSESKSELEQTQREKAWREIAQQVAHEIKNPLTPMKLTLQQLERAVQTGNNTTEKTSRAITTLLDQVETLNEIASSFSGFVKMPEPVIQPLDVIAEVKRVIDLHSPTGEISFRTNSKEAWAMGDAQLLSRTFSNIILNALQSGKPGQSIQVHITIETNSEKCKIVFIDNGKGIEPQIVDRVFLPHFSTKKSGSGLGLAISKQAIELMKGRIWFETQVDRGTSFFIELPLLKKS